MASKRKKSNRSTPVIDISQARSNLEAIRQSVKELGWKEVLTNKIFLFSNKTVFI